MKQAKWISLAFVMGMGAGGIGANTLADAAVGDAIYETPPERACISAAEAACYADCAIAAGAWSGDRADIIKACGQRVVANTCASGYEGVTRGLKAAPLADVPVGSAVHGVVE